MKYTSCKNLREKMTEMREKNISFSYSEAFPFMARESDPRSPDSSALPRTNERMRDR